VNYSIDFGETGHADVQTTTTAQHTYTTQGTFTVTVTATDSADATKSDTKQYKVTVTGQPATPGLSVSASPTAGTALTADGASSKAGANPIASYTFDFGDGSASAVQTATAPATTATHTYANGGTYTVILTVTDSNGVSAVTSKQIVVAGVPAPPVVVPPTNPMPTPTPTPNPLPNPNGLVLDQIGGPDRYATGIDVSQHRWGAGQADAVVVATGNGFADALAGVPLAAKAHGPLLLVNGTAAAPDQRVVDEINRVLKPGGTVYILGGTSAVSQSIQNHLGAAHTTHRFAGLNRYQTSVTIAVDGLGSPARTVVATGNGFADALASGPYATGPFTDAPGAPAAIILTDDTTLDPSAAAYLAGKASADITAIGHQATIAVPRAAVRLQGATRFETDQQVAAAFTGTHAGTQVGVADGMNFPDALTGGAYMASLTTPGPIVLVDGQNKIVPVTTTAILAGRAGDAEADIFGGQAVVTAAMAGVIASALGTTTVHHIGF
jgi:putative cell wall-binding protein